MLKENKHIQEFFYQNKEELNIEKMNSGHNARFLGKLQEPKKTVKKIAWYYYAAAVLVLCIASSFLFNIEEMDTPTVVETKTTNFHQEVANAQFHFEGIIKNELVKLELERNEDTQEIIENAFNQLKVLETEQQNLQEQLNSSYDKRIVKALINNFQYRIQLLENVMKQIEITKEIKTLENEII